MSNATKFKTTVTIDSYEVAIAIVANPDGEEYLQLSGVDCDLHGEGPGIYYPVPQVLAR